MWDFVAICHVVKLVSYLFRISPGIRLTPGIKSPNHLSEILPNLHDRADRSSLYDELGQEIHTRCVVNGLRRDERDRQG